MIDPNVSFHKYENTPRAAFNIISNPSLGILNGLSIPSGICLYKNKNCERVIPREKFSRSSSTITTKCISDGVFDKLFNLASYKTSRKRGKTRHLKKYNNNNNLTAGPKTSYKKKNKKI